MICFCFRVRDDAPRVDPSPPISPEVRDSSGRKRHYHRRRSNDSESDEPPRIVVPHGGSPAQMASRLSSKVVCLTASASVKDEDSRDEGSDHTDKSEEESSEAESNTHHREVRFGRKFKNELT